MTGTGRRVYMTFTDLAPIDRKPTLTRQHEVPLTVTPKVHRPPPPPHSHTHIAQQTEIHTGISNRLVKIKSKMQTIINRPPSEPWQRPHRVKKRPQGHQSTQEATQKLAPYQLHPAAFCDWRPMHAPPDGAATYR